MTTIGYSRRQKICTATNFRWPFAGGLTVVNVHAIEQLAELGMVLLLFSLGLELSFRELKPVRAVALGGAAI
jgi:CPA2 family monovalent cation:H+ antiporter-2